jgi:hypothetical protein
MPFVNEFISKSDIEKYGLDKIYFDLNPSQTELPSSFNPHWTIDRERDIIFRQIRAANPARDGEHWIEFCLDVAGKKIFVKIDRAHGSKSFNESPYLIAWDRIIDIYPLDIEDNDIHKIHGMLKEALTVRGYDGARKQIPNTTVTFNF